MTEDEDAVDKRFKQVMLEGTERWISMADDKLKGKVPRVIVCPANDDMFEIDPILQSGHVVEIGRRGAARARGVHDGVATAGRTRRRGTRSASCPRSELGERIDAIVEKVSDPEHDDLQLPRAAVRHRLGRGARRWTPT